MEWWHVGPLILAIIVFLLAGTLIERQVESAVFRIIAREPPASQASVGVETSRIQQYEEQQKEQQRKEQLKKEQQSREQQKIEQQEVKQMLQQPSRSQHLQQPSRSQHLQQPSRTQHLQQQQKQLKPQLQHNDTMPPLPAVSEKSILHPTSKTTVVSRAMEATADPKI